MIINFTYTKFYCDLGTKKSVNVVTYQKTVLTNNSQDNLEVLRQVVNIYTAFVAYLIRYQKF